MIGTELGRYRILERIGASGMGEVYRARDQSLHRDVALKVLPAATAEDQAAGVRLLREARAAAALNHPNICTVHEVGEAEGCTFVAMELIERQSRDHLISPGKGLPIDEAIHYGVQTAGAVALAHERGILHRDLKTANVMITPAGQGHGFRPRQASRRRQSRAKHDSCRRRRHSGGCADRHARINGARVVARGAGGCTQRRLGARHRVVRSRDWNAALRRPDALRDERRDSQRLAPAVGRARAGAPAARH